MSCGCYVFQAFFPPYESLKFQHSLTDSKFPFMFPFPLKLPRYIHALVILFSVSYCRATSLLPLNFPPCARKLSSIHFLYSELFLFLNAKLSFWKASFTILTPSNFDATFSTNCYNSLTYVCPSFSHRRDVSPLCLFL